MFFFDENENENRFAICKLKMKMLKVVHVAQILFAGAIANILMNMFVNEYENRSAMCKLKMKLFFARCS